MVIFPILTHSTKQWAWDTFTFPSGFSKVTNVKFLLESNFAFRFLFIIRYSIFCKATVCQSVAMISFSECLMLLFNAWQDAGVGKDFLSSTQFA